MVHSAGRGQPDRIGDLADRGRIPAITDRLGDAVEDALPAFDVVPGQLTPSALVTRARHGTVAERMF
jgi:hypothetical protein